MNDQVYGQSLADLMAPAQVARNRELARRLDAGEPLMTPEEVRNLPGQAWSDGPYRDAQRLTLGPLTQIFGHPNYIG